MKIRMIENARGYDDGIHPHDYKSGDIYDVTESLANNFFEMKVAELVEEKEKAPHANKALTDYQNKSEKPNKRERSES